MNEPTTADQPALQSDPRQDVDDARLLLTSVRRTLADLLAQVANGGGTTLKDIGLKQAELESALKRVFETEQKFHDWHSRQTGRAEPGDLDLAQLRHQIGCRLARLRECCDEGRIPG